MDFEASHIEVPGAPSPSPAQLHRSQPWYLAYMDALFESDRTLVGQRIKQAERMIVLRERELIASQLGSPEQRALANALHALRALRSCLGV